MQSPSNIIEKDSFGSARFLVRGSIMLDGHMNLHFFQENSVGYYCTEILLLHMHQFRVAVSADFFSMKKKFHLIVQYLSQSSWRVKILNLWMDL